MSKKTFTEQEVCILRQNPFTFKATQHSLYFTKEFKELFLKEFNAGKIPRQILADHGYDPEMLGDRRVWGISYHIRKQYEKYGDVHEGITRSKPPVGRTTPLSEKDELKQLRHEVDYMKQQIEFLKKISSTRTTGK